MSVNLRLGEAYMVSFLESYTGPMILGSCPPTPPLTQHFALLLVRGEVGEQFWCLTVVLVTLHHMIFSFINGDFIHHLSRKMDKDVRCHRMSEFKYLCIFIQINTSLFSLTLRARVKYCWEIVPVVTWVSGTSWNCFKRWLNSYIFSRPSWIKRSY